MYIIMYYMSFFCSECIRPWLPSVVTALTLQGGAKFKSMNTKKMKGQCNITFLIHENIIFVKDRLEVFVMRKWFSMTLKAIWFVVWNYLRFFFSLECWIRKKIFPFFSRHKTMFINFLWRKIFNWFG